MGTIPAQASIASCIKMRAHDQKDYWLMRKWSQRKRKIKAHNPTKPFGFY